MKQMIKVFKKDLFEFISIVNGSALFLICMFLTYGISWRLISANSKSIFFDELIRILIDVTFYYMPILLALIIVFQFYAWSKNARKRILLHSPVLGVVVGVVLRGYDYLFKYSSTIYDCIPVLVCLLMYFIFTHLIANGLNKLGQKRAKVDS